MEMVISNSGKLHCRQQPTCTVVSYNHHHCLSQGSQLLLACSCQPYFGVFFRSQEKVQNVPSQPRLSDSLAMDLALACSQPRIIPFLFQTSDKVT